MNVDLMHVIEQIGREKGIERDVLIDAVGAAILSASRKTLGAAQDLRVAFDDRSGSFKLYAIRKVVEEPANPKVEIGLEEAQRLKADAKLDDELAFEVPPEQVGQFGRIAAQTAKQVIIQRVREAERDMVYQSFKEKEGDVVNGVVQRVVKGNVIVSVGRAEAILPPREQLPREDYRVGDRVRAYVLDVRKTPKGSQVVVSRTHPGFLVKLFEMEVPEIHEGIVEVKAAAREPGERAKIAVTSKDPNVDPVGACVGYRGSRVQAVVRELHGEKIDIIPWRADPMAFVKTALAPAESEAVTVDEENHALQVVVADEQLSLAIGKKGVNARLAAKLVGWKVDIKSRSEAQATAAAALFGEPGEAGAEALAAAAAGAEAGADGAEGPGADAAANLEELGAAAAPAETS
ncbi:MAG TPA: transcription termination factor NusA [Candidatus Sulfotelmatobacter sp.]|nr:transcription termination factor NusA [Candidatus Sulfotelmatobacter sp.]